MYQHHDLERNEMFVLDSPYAVKNWRPLVHPLLCIPHLMIISLLQQVVNLLILFNWLHVLFVGRLNPGLYAFVAGFERYRVRSGAFLFGFSEKYPPFDFNLFPDDNDAYPPVRLNPPHVPEQTPRTALLNLFLAIPHYVVYILISISAIAVLIIAWFAVLFTGKWPQDMRDFIVRVVRYGYRIWVYVMMVDTRYPKFGI